jgi:hypothetical protein
MSPAPFILALLLFASQLQAQEACNCDPNSQLVGLAFKVRGHLSPWNGTPSLRISIIGTKRMLGVRDGSPIPATLEPTTKTFESSVVADFVLCPLTKPKPGVMQIVCIQSASNIRSKLQATK